jgi:hypothetical protein
VSSLGHPWFVGAWRRRSIMVPGGQPTEPCDAWWIQSGEAFVDVRVAAPGKENNGLPYSSTRAFAGRFEIADGEVRWHVELDSDGPVPRTDRAAAAGLFIAEHDPLLMIEDAPGRFREEWVQHAPQGHVEFVRAAEVVTVRVGAITGVVYAAGNHVCGRVWAGGRLTAVGASRGSGELVDVVDEGHESEHGDQ